MLGSKYCADAVDQQSAGNSSYHFRVLSSDMGLLLPVLPQRRKLYHTRRETRKGVFSATVRRSRRQVRAKRATTARRGVRGVRTGSDTPKPCGAFPCALWRVLWRSRGSGGVAPAQTVRRVPVRPVARPVRFCRRRSRPRPLRRGGILRRVYRQRVINNLFTFRKVCRRLRPVFRRNMAAYTNYRREYAQAVIL